MSSYEGFDKRGRFDSGGLHSDQEDTHGSNGGQLQFQEEISTVPTTTSVAMPSNVLGQGDRFNPQTTLESWQHRVLTVTEHFIFRVFTIFMILFDVIVVIVDLSTNGDKTALEVLSLIIVSYFLLEVMVRIFAKGFKKFFTNWMDVVDFVIIVISFIFTVIYTAADLSKNAAFAKLIVAGRFIRIVLLFRIITEKRHLEKSSRLMVSQNKRRYQKDGFDLDLCYITDRVIAMSFPSKGLMALYRNPIREVARFLDTKHRDHYKVFNLCSERMYDESMFHYSVERIRIDDHNVPKLHEMQKFARTARDWMDADPENIIAVHCKGGKGRTGTIICTWLIESGNFAKAQDSLAYFGDRRTDKSVGKSFQGVETPSQSRYVGYFEITKSKLDGQLPAPKTLQLNAITIYGFPAAGPGDGSDLHARVTLEERAWEFDFGKQENCKIRFDRSSRTLAVELLEKPVVTNDVKMVFFSPNLPKGYDKCSFYFWFYTSFIEGNKLTLKREELDNPHKEARWKQYGEDFAVELHFSKPSQ